MSGACSAGNAVRLSRTIACSVSSPNLHVQRSAEAEQHAISVHCKLPVCTVGALQAVCVYPHLPSNASDLVRESSLKMSSTLRQNKVGPTGMQERLSRELLLLKQDTKQPATKLGRAQWAATENSLSGLSSAGGSASGTVDGVDCGCIQHAVSPRCPVIYTQLFAISCTKGAGQRTDCCSTENKYGNIETLPTT